MMNIHSRTRKSREDGFTLLELLLVIGVASVLFLGIIKITTGWVDNEVADGAGQQLQRVSAIVQSYVEANWNNADPTLTLTPTDDAIHSTDLPWASLKSELDQEGLLNNGELRTPLNAPLKVAYIIDASSGNKIYRATIYATQALPYKRVIEAARESGNTGGIINTFPDSTSAFGAFGQWKVPVAKLLPSGSAPCTPNSGNACLVAMISYNQQTLCGPFLYRSDVETGGLCAGGNTMTTDLNMNTNNITDAGNIAAQSLTVNGNADLAAATVSGNTTLQGPVTASNGMNITAGGMTVIGDSTFSNDVTMGGGSLTATDLTANTVQAATIATNALNADNMTMTGTNATLSVDNSITVNGNVSVAGSNAEILATTVNAGQINAGGGEVRVGSMEIDNTLNIKGQVNVTGGAIAVNQLVANHCVQILKTDGTYESHGTCP
jgi:prepilin-type N-terminal cleavage/methylation domain-containing protein